MPAIEAKLAAYKSEAEHELTAILDYWMANTVDEIHGGFLGELSNQNVATPNASKGAVLNARILWSFSAASRIQNKAVYRSYAERAYETICERFIDKENGGVFWEISPEGQVLNARKQIYANAFTIYAFAEYYQAFGNPEALEKAIQLFNLIEEHSFDAQNNGYLEAMARDWTALEDLRLSDKDENAPKTMNTHLHILEGYTNLYRVWKNERLAEQLRNLIGIHLDIIVQSNAHFGLFFDLEWNVSTPNISYGHDIEGAWLMLEAAEVLGDEELIEKVKPVSVEMARVTKNEGLWADFSVKEELHVESGKQDTSRHWWPQAEAMVGFFNAYQLSNDINFLELSLSAWKFIQDHIIDKENGEWFWRVEPDGRPVADECKVGMWKCPYHNSRACMEIIQRIA